MAVLPVLDVGSGPINLIAPNYAPVEGNSGIHPNGWTYGGGGNYIRPYQSFSQRIIDSSFILGPFAMRLGGNITGRVVISTESESLSQLAYRDQPWYEFDDGNTGYASKAEWWGNVVKTVIQVRDLNTEGHPMIHVEVAYFDPGHESPKRYSPRSGWSNFASRMSGFVPNNFGWLSGNPFPTPPNNGGPTIPPVLTMTNAATNWASNMVGNFANAITSAYQTTTGQVATSASNFIQNVMDGIEAGQLGVNNHIEHNRTPPDQNGNFNNIPGETPSNPKDLIMRNGLQQSYAANLGDGSNLGTAVGDVATANGVDSGKLHISLVNGGLDTSRNWYGIANQGKGTTAFYIHGRTIFNNGNSGGNSAAATNPTIDQHGNLRIFDTYEFQNSGLDFIGNWVSANIDNNAGQELNAFFDTSPGFHTAPSLSDAGAVRVENEGGTAGNSNISSLQNTYTGVVITPHNLQSGNPTLYNALKNNGFFNHVDQSLIP